MTRFKDQCCAACNSVLLTERDHDHAIVLNRSVLAFPALEFGHANPQMWDEGYEKAWCDMWCFVDWIGEAFAAIVIPS